jgi:hypothetical protein
MENRNFKSNFHSSLVESFAFLKFNDLLLSRIPPIFDEIKCHQFPLFINLGKQHKFIVSLRFILEK